MQIDPQRLLAELPGTSVNQVGRLGIALAPRLNREAWGQLVAHLARLTRTTTGARQTLTAWLGDALAYGDVSYRGRITSCAAEAGLEPGTLRNAKMVCSRIPLSCRRETLSWSHHCEAGLAFSDLKEIERWLLKAETEQLSTAALRRGIRAEAEDKSRTSARSNSLASVEAFKLMREIRAADRALKFQRALWRGWTPRTARLALREAPTLSEFMETMLAKARGPESPVSRYFQAN